MKEQNSEKEKAKQEPGNPKSQKIETGKKKKFSLFRKSGKPQGSRIKKVREKIKYRSKKKFHEHLEKAGFSLSPEKLTEKVFKASVIMNVVISIGLLAYFALTPGYSLTYILIIITFLWTLGFISILFIIWFLLYLFIDLQVYKRKMGIEEVFPDFLQLTSANIRAGMPIDQALWHAIRPNFGVLAKEIENVAKQTMTGEALEKALYDFGNKYESTLIKRSISLLVEGLNAGGEIGELLDRISNNIIEAKTMKKEMAASVTTYAIFISFAAIVAAPFLLALSSQLLIIIEKIISTINIPSNTGSAMAISFSKVGVKPSDFRIFALVTLTITSVLSAAIVATIKKGNIKDGLKYIPSYIIATVTLYFILDFVLGVFLAGIF